MTEQPEIHVTEVAALTWPTSAELSAGWTVPDVFAVMLRNETPEERRDREARQAVERQERTKRQAAGIASLMAESNDDTAAAVGRLLRLVELHSPDEDGWCEGCLGDEYGTRWPCTEWLIAVGEEDA